MKKAKVLGLVAIALLASAIAASALAEIAGATGAGVGAAGGDGRLEERLLKASEGLQMPGSEADSEWWFVSYPGEPEPPTAERMAFLTGCSGYPEGGMGRSDFDATFDSLGRVQPWMDAGQRESARGFRKLGRLFHRRYGEDLAVYRCDTGEFGRVHVYFVGANGDGLSGLMTVNIET